MPKDKARISYTNYQYLLIKQGKHMKYCGTVVSIINYYKQAEAEVVPSSSSVKFKFLKFS